MDIWDQVFRWFSSKDLIQMIPFNKHSAIALYRIKWRTLLWRHLSKPLVQQALLQGTFPYHTFVESIEIKVNKSTLPSDLQFLTCLQRLRQVSLLATDNIYRDMHLQPGLLEFFEILRQNPIHTIKGSCRLLQALSHHPTVHTILLCCEWTENSAKVIQSFPNVISFTLSKRLASFTNFTTLDTIQHITIETSWLKQSSFDRLFLAFPNMKTLVIHQEFGDEPINLSSSKIHCLYVHRLNIASYPTSLRSLYCWGLDLRCLANVPIHQLNKCHYSVSFHHVSELFDAWIHTLPTLLQATTTCQSYSICMDDSNSALVFTNDTSSFQSPLVESSDIRWHPLKHQAFGVYASESIPAFIEYIGFVMLTSLYHANVISKEDLLTCQDLLQEEFTVYPRDARHELVLKDIHSHL